MPLVVSAEDIDERFSVSLGGFFTDRITDLRLDGSLGRGLPVNFEKDLGLDSVSRVFRLDGYYRFQGPHRLDFSVFDLSRSASKQIDKTIEWGDEVFQIGAELETRFDLEIYKAAYTYEFRQSETGFLGVTGGLYVADSATRLIANVTGQRELRSLTAPLPVLGLRGEREFADCWKLRVSGEFFFLEYDGYDGTIWDLYAAVDYEVSDHVSIGAGLNSVRLNVRTSKDRFDGRMKWRYNGALLFLKFDF